MTTTQPIRLLSLLASALLAACGGSSSSSPSSSASPPPAQSALAVRGTISAMAASSLTVNGLSVDTSSAAIEIERRQGSLAELHHGMVVHVRGTIDRSTGRARATRVSFGDDLQGRASADVAAGATSIAVGGKTVQLEDSTRVLDDRGVDLAPEALRRDDRLSVSGFTDDQGRLRASSIQRLASASADDSFEVKGWVVAIAAGRASFDLSLTPGGPVAFAVTLASGALAPAISVGSFVEVHAPATASGTAVTGATVLLDDDALGEAEAEAEVEGFVTAGSAASFQVGSQTITTGGATRWENGVAADLAPGVKVEAEGRLDASGNLAAEKVSFKDSSRLQGVVGGSAGAFTVLGFPLHVGATTEGASLLVAGSFVEVRGTPRASGDGLVVARVKAVSSGNPKSFLQGPVAAASGTAGTLEILGVTLTAAPGASFSDHESATLARDAFFAKVTPGRSVVKARVSGAPSGTPPAASSDELELEDEAGTHP